MFPAKQTSGVRSRLLGFGWFSGRLAGSRGVTLVETMMATTIFTMGMLGVYTMMIYSYKMETLARYRDSARSVLLTYADQFERLQTTDPATQALRNFFDTVPTTPNGTGLSWTDNSGNVTVGVTSGITILIGDATSAQIPAVVTELVKNADANAVNAPATGMGANGAAGRVIEATFTITYTIPGVPQVQTLSMIVTRAVP